MTVPSRNVPPNPAYLRSDVTDFLAAPWAEEAIGPLVGHNRRTLRVFQPKFNL